ncbi:hypothetical protein F4810DRAFT_709422 [Camillea tinctor]|nr:hypothetical protein F4810DRAFT_709422 [Camillea tinctor]
MPGHHRHQEAASSNPALAVAAPEITRPRRHGSRYAGRPNKYETAPVDERSGSEPNDPSVDYLVAVDNSDIASLAPQSPADLDLVNYHTVNDTVQYCPNIESELCDEAHWQTQEATELRYAVQAQHTAYQDQTSSNIGWTISYSYDHDGGSGVYQPREAREFLEDGVGPDITTTIPAMAQPLTYQAQILDWSHVPQDRRSTETDGPFSSTGELARREGNIWELDDSSDRETREQAVHRYLRDDQGPFDGISRQYS